MLCDIYGAEKLYYAMVSASLKMWSRVIWCPLILQVLLCMLARNIAGHYWELFKFREDALLWSIPLHVCRANTLMQLLMRLGLRLQLENLMWHTHGSGIPLMHALRGGKAPLVGAGWEVGKVRQTVESREQVESCSSVNMVKWPVTTKDAGRAQWRPCSFCFFFALPLNVVVHRS